MSHSDYKLLKAKSTDLINFKTWYEECLKEDKGNGNIERPLEVANRVEDPTDVQTLDFNIDLTKNMVKVNLTETQKKDLENWTKQVFPFRIETTKKVVSIDALVSATNDNLSRLNLRVKDVPPNHIDKVIEKIEQDNMHIGAAINNMLEGSGVSAVNKSLEEMKVDLKNMVLQAHAKNIHQERVHGDSDLQKLSRNIKCIKHLLIHCGRDLMSIENASEKINSSINSCPKEVHQTVIELNESVKLIIDTLDTKMERTMGHINKYESIIKSENKNDEL